MVEIFHFYSTGGAIISIRKGKRGRQVVIIIPPYLLDGPF
jgi:hypothetical protein